MSEIIKDNGVLCVNVLRDDQAYISDTEHIALTVTPARPRTPSVVTMFTVDAAWLIPSTNNQR